MFNNDRYITRGIKQKINPLHYLYLWELIDDMDVEKKDYLQVFTLRTKFNIFDKRYLLKVEHSQEQPSYKQVHKFFTVVPVDAKIYVIDDGEHSTMLLAEEY